MTEPQDNRTGSQSGQAETNWERNLISRIAMGALNEQRRARRWGILFKSLLFIYLFALLMLYLPLDLTRTATGKEHTALVDIEGLITANTQAKADNVATGLRRAFENKYTRGIVLRINSPGGSPVQAGYIYDEIVRLRNEYPDIPLYAVITDTCASGGYYIAAAADEIYANKASVIGSIGVVFAGFGFVEAMEKLGIERRLMTAGDRKGLLDPFSPMEEDDAEHLQQLLESIHGQFIDVVIEGRGDRLADDDRIFSGLVWTGEQSLDLGLVDGFGSAGYVAREVIGHENITDYTVRETYFDRFARGLGTAIADRFRYPMSF